MNRLVFKTRKELSEWKQNNDIYSCFTAFGTFIGMITQDEVDELDDIVTVNVELNSCSILPLLNDKQVKCFKEAHCCKVYIQEEIVKLTSEQSYIVARIRALFKEAVDAGIMFCSTDDSPNLYAFNFMKCTDIMDSDGDTEVYDKKKGAWVKVPEDDVIEVPNDMLSVINEGVDFSSWGSCMLPWRVRVKKSYRWSC